MITIYLLHLLYFYLFLWMKHDISPEPHISDETAKEIDAGDAYVGHALGFMKLGT
jgi:hypothetical protein